MMSRISAFTEPSRACRAASPCSTASRRAWRSETACLRAASSFSRSAWRSLTSALYWRMRASTSAEWLVARLSRLTSSSTALSESELSITCTMSVSPCM